jgi:hypothetical protein
MNPASSWSIPARLTGHKTEKQASLTNLVLAVYSKISPHERGCIEDMNAIGGSINEQHEP